MKQIIVRSFTLLLLVAQIVGCGSKSVTTPTTPPVIIVPKPEFNTSGFTFSPNDSILYNTSVTIGFEVKNATSVSVDGAILKENSYATGNLTQSKEIKFIATGKDGSVVSHTVHIHVFSLNTTLWSKIDIYAMTQNEFYPIGNPNKVTPRDLSCDLWKNYPNNKTWVKFGPCAGALSGKEGTGDWHWVNSEEKQMNFGTESQPDIRTITIDLDGKGFEERQEKQGYVFIRHYRRI